MHFIQHLFISLERYTDIMVDRDNCCCNFKLRLCDGATHHLYYWLVRLVTSCFFLNSSRLRSETAGPNGSSFVEVTQITPCVTVDLVKFHVSLYPTLLLLPSCLYSPSLIHPISFLSSSASLLLLALSTLPAFHYQDTCVIVIYTSFFIHQPFVPRDDILDTYT